MEMLCTQTLGAMWAGRVCVGLSRYGWVLMGGNIIHSVLRSGISSPPHVPCVKTGDQSSANQEETKIVDEEQTPIISDEQSPTNVFLRTHKY